MIARAIRNTTPQNPTSTAKPTTAANGAESKTKLTRDRRTVGATRNQRTVALCGIYFGFGGRQPPGKSNWLAGRWHSRPARHRSIGHNRSAVHAKRSDRLTTIAYHLLASHIPIPTPLECAMEVLACGARRA
jgi:hypothetical protein